MIRVILAITVLTVLWIAIAIPTAANIESCMEATGWSKARCEMELMR